MYNQVGIDIVFKYFSRMKMLDCKYWKYSWRKGKEYFFKFLESRKTEFSCSCPNVVLYSWSYSLFSDNNSLYILKYLSWSRKFKLSFLSLFANLTADQSQSTGSSRFFKKSVMITEIYSKSQLLHKQCNLYQSTFFR